MTDRAKNINFKDYQGQYQEQHKDRLLRDRIESTQFAEQASHSGDITEKLLASMIAKLEAEPFLVDADFSRIEPRIIAQIHDEITVEVESDLLGTRHPTDALSYYGMKPTTGGVRINRTVPEEPPLILSPEERVKEWLVYAQGLKKYQHIVKRDGGYFLPGYLTDNGIDTWVEYEWPKEN